MAYLLLSLKVVEILSYPYILSNLIGSLILSVVAFQDEAFGFWILNSVWAGVATSMLIQRWLRRNEDKHNS